MLSRHNEPAVPIWKQLVSVSNISILALIKKGCIQDYMSWKVSNMIKYNPKNCAISLALGSFFQIEKMRPMVVFCGFLT